MKRIITILNSFLFTAAFLAAYSTWAVAGAQQERMKACNEEAGKQALQEEERKQFMSSCLAAPVSASEHKLTSQQEKMRECNKEARDKSLKGDERKKFMSECLKG